MVIFQIHESARLSPKSTICELFKAKSADPRTYSPPSFNLYLNNLPHLFENTLSDPFVLPNGKKINSLLYADDLVIPARSKTGLQNCDKWKLKINLKKTKIMIFQKRPKKSIDIKFNIGSESIEIVQEYTYLRV